MQAINNFIILKIEKLKPETSKSSLILFSKKEFTGTESVNATVVSVNKKHTFLKDGDTVILNANMGGDFEVDGEVYKIITDNNYLVKVVNGLYAVPPKKVMVRIKKEDRDSLFSKWIVKENGDKVQLFTTIDVESDADARASTLFVSIGTVEQVGEGVEGIEVDDVALLDYLCDNEDSNIVSFEENGDKLIVVDADTKFHEREEWIYGSRKNDGKDKLLAAVGDIDTQSPIIAVVRNEKIIARQCYVILEHESATVTKVGKGGIMYEEEEKVVTRKILAVSKESAATGLQVDGSIIVRDCDVFDAKLQDGSKAQCVLDNDIMAAVI